MNIKVAKFGGSSLASAGQFRKVKDILLSDPERKYVVPSAPGRRFKNDIKVTDLLYNCFRLAEKGKNPKRLQRVGAIWICGSSS